VILGVLVDEAQPAPARAGGEFLSGRIQVSGEFAHECAPSASPFRPGMQAELKVAGPDGAFCRLPVLLTATLAIQPVNPKLRRYRWAYLVPARPSADPLQLFPAPPGGQRLAGEVTLEELLTLLGGEGGSATAVQFTSEGGFMEAPRTPPG
jgi:hypothetical protein